MKEDKHKIILFDGVCNLCNGAVRHIIERDKKDIYRFAALQSDIGQKLISERHIDTSVVDSIILVEPGIAYYIKSDATIEIARDIGGIWSVLALFRWIPVRLRNIVYDFIARNRYSWYGKKEQCMVPTPELKAKFLG
ncbi:MAG: thiol-disulfide oxidoreductase DCC family protein [Maribacter sp.]|nr:thiol-disulfide oxidoreductase DCC family protein [Maribacter sp.]